MKLSNITSIFSWWHPRWTVRCGGEEGEDAVWEIRHVPGSSGSDPPLCHVREEGSRWLRAVQENVAALSTPFLCLSRHRFLLQGSLLQVIFIFKLKLKYTLVWLVTFFAVCAYNISNKLFARIILETPHLFILVRIKQTNSFHAHKISFTWPVLFV